MSDSAGQLFNVKFLTILRNNLVTDSFGYEQFPEQRQLLQLAIEVYFPSDATWQDTAKKLSYYKNQQTVTYSRDWLDHLLSFYHFYLFMECNVSLHALLETKMISPSEFLLYVRKQILAAFPDKETEADHIFAPMMRRLETEDLDGEQLAAMLSIKLNDENLMKVYKNCLPELEPRSVIKFSESIRSTMNKEKLSFQQKYHWKNWSLGGSYWKKFLFQIILLSIVAVFLFWGIKIINQYYEKIIIEKITLLEPNFLWLDTKLTFKSDTDVPQKAVKLTSTQIDDLEKLERVEQLKSQSTEFLPESDILDTSVAIGGWGSELGLGRSESEDTDAESIGNEYRDIYDGYSRSYRLMLNSVDLFEMRQKVIGLFRRYQVKEASISMVGKESLDGVYFNVFVAANQIQDFIQEIGSIETTNTYISKTTYRPPKGYERVFIWVKKI